MGSLLAAEPPFEDFVREHSPLLALLFFVLLALLVVRLVVKTVTRVLLLGIIAMLVLFVTIERDNITECTQTCSCTLAGFDVSIAWCNEQLDRA